MSSAAMQEKDSATKGLVFCQMAAVSLFLDTTMANIMSYESAPCINVDETSPSHPFFMQI